MNLVLFEADELGRPLPRGDRRAQHVLSVLKRKAGEVFDAGQVNGPRGKATITAITDTAVTFTFAATHAPSAPPSTTLILGLPRPQTARDILRDATSLGVAAIHFVATEKGESSYAQSTLWSSGEWRRHVIAGAEQAFDTRIPEVTFSRTLADVLVDMPPSGRRFALDNYESPESLGRVAIARETPVVIAVGSERGWSAGERAALRAASFEFVHLGERVLRTETAVVAALAIVGATRARE